MISYIKIFLKTSGYTGLLNIEMLENVVISSVLLKTKWLLFLNVLHIAIIRKWNLILIFYENLRYTLKNIDITLNFFLYTICFLLYDVIKCLR